jgi:hypothetical protein
MADPELKIFDAHFHIIDPRFPLFAIDEVHRHDFYR